MAAITQPQGWGAFTSRRYGSFAGKTEGSVVIPGPDGNLVGICFVPREFRLEFVPEVSRLEFVPRTNRLEFIPGDGQ